MREIKEIIVHCSASAFDKDIGALEIKQWHIDRGFKDIGYHFIIRLDGKVEKGRNEEEIGAHTKGHNKNSMGICYIGGIKEGKPSDTRTKAQKEALKTLITELKQRFKKAKVYGHRDFNPLKACPCFEVQDEF